MLSYTHHDHTIITKRMVKEDGVAKVYDIMEFGNFSN